MAEKKYFWLKLKENFFNDKEIKKLRKIAGGDTYTIIYLKLMLLSLKTEGWLYYDGIEETFFEELALEIDEEPNNVKVTLIYLQKMGLMEEKNANESFLTQLPEMIGSETDKAELMRKSRARKKALETKENGNNVTQMLPPVTFCYTEIEKEKEIEKEIEIDYNGIKDAYNTLCPSLQSVKILSDARKKLIKARLKTYSVEQIHEVFRKAEASDFMTNRNDSGWKATFDWIMKDSNFVKVLDGNYDNRNSNKQPYVDNSDKLRDIFE